MAFDQDELNKRREARTRERQFMARQRLFMKIGLIVTGVTLVCCAAALLIAGGIINSKKPSDKPSLQAPTTQPPIQTTPPPTVPDTVIHFVAGGDLNVTDKVVSSGTAISGFDFTSTFLDVAPVLAGGDLTALNLEGSLYGEPYGSRNHSAPPQMMQALQAAGVDLIQTANSYAVVNGISGLKQTISGIQSAGMTPVGTFTDSGDFRKSGGYVIRNVQGVKIAIVGFTKGMDGMGLPDGSEDCVNLLYTDYNSAYQTVDTAGIKAVLRAAQSQSPDITIALLHWGSEYNDQISKTQNKITELMLAEGVDAIIGTHSHYVQQVVHDPQKGTLIAYSLGDFFGDGEKAGTNYSILLDVEITKNGTTGKASVTGFSYTPVYIADETAAGKGLRLLRIREAIAAYESNSLVKVSDEAYRGMVAALERIESRVNGT